MCNVIIVDDDRIIRRSLSTVVPWKENGFQLIGEAADGETGLELIAENPPQIVVSDIKMPYMDGLEMAEKIKEHYPDIKVILLTGYEDFAFAQKAIKVRAFDYLLKPVETSLLIEKAKEARSEWEKEQKDKQKIKIHQPFLKQQFLQKLLQKQISPADISSLLEEFELSFPGTSFTSFLLKLDKPVESNGESSLMKEALFSLAEECLRNGVLFEVSDGEYAGIVSFFNAKEKARDQIEQLHKKIKSSLNTTVTIAIGKEYTSLLDVADAYLEASAAMEFRHMIGKDQIFSMQDLNVEAVDQKGHVSPFVNQQLLSKVKLGLTEEAEAVFSDGFFESIKKSYMPLQDVQLYAIRLIIPLFEELEKWKIHSPKEITAVFHEINSMQTVQEISDYVRSIVRNVTNSINEQSKTRKKSVVDQAVEYIEAHFDEEGLTLQKVAETVHMNTAYLSSQFKAEQGINFGDFLLDLRMKKAMELLRHENLKIYEVAERVGYSNPQYFSACFKQYTHYSPGQFKKLS